jgi:hypothetical protein
MSERRRLLGRLSHGRKGRHDRQSRYSAKANGSDGFAPSPRWGLGLTEPSRALKNLHATADTVPMRPKHEAQSVKRLSIIILAVLGLAIAVAGCGSTAAESTKTTQPSTPTATSASSHAGSSKETEAEQADPSGYKGWTKGQVKMAIEGAHEGDHRPANVDAECVARTEIRSYTYAEVVAGLSPSQKTKVEEESAACEH